MMLKKNILGALALTLMAALGGACGNNEPDHDNIDTRIAVIDTDNDLIVSVTEWNAAFAVFDVDHDGQLTATEFQFNATGFASADVNRDAFISQAEWNATLAVWDVNADSVLEASEFTPFL